MREAYCRAVVEARRHLGTCRTLAGRAAGQDNGGVEYDAYGKGQVWLALVTFLYVDLFDTTGTLYAMAKFSGLVDPVTKDFERSTVAYCVDAFSISMGSLMGTSPVTAFIESATGISDGGKTGITAISASIWFFISIFFSPIFASIPSYATGGALVICGSLMITNVREINWFYIGDAIPAFLTLIIIPFSYNIAYGIIAGISSFILINGITWIIKELSGGTIVPVGYYNQREEWSLPDGGLRPVWLRKLMAGDKRFWVDEGDLSDYPENAPASEPRISDSLETDVVHEKDVREQLEARFSGADRV